MTPIKLAIIGMGKIARDQHHPALAADPRFALVATVDPHAGVADVPNFADLATLLASGPSIDAVAICTPPQVRATLADQAIAAGLHVLLEKPPAATLSAFDALAEGACAAGTTLFAAWHSREAAMVDAARDWLAGRTVTGGHVHWREDVRRWHPGQEWLWAPGGLGVFDPAINAFSILTTILPRPASVRTAALHVPENGHTAIRAQLMLATGAATLAVDLDFLQTGEQTWDIVLDTADGGRLRLAHGGATMQVDDRPVEPGTQAEYPRLYARFAGLIAARASDTDAAPLRLVADALLVASSHRAHAFHY